MVSRVTRVRTGEPRSNAIAIEAVEDPYGAEFSTFAPIPKE